LKEGVNKPNTMQQYKQGFQRRQHFEDSRSEDIPEREEDEEASNKCEKNNYINPEIQLQHVPLTNNTNRQMLEAFNMNNT